MQLVAVVPGAVWYATGYLHSLYTAAEQSSALRGPEVVLARLVFAANGSALSRPALVRRGIGRRQLMAASCPGDWGWLVCHWLPCAPAARRPRGLLPAPQRPYLRPSELYPPEEARALISFSSLALVFQLLAVLEFVLLDIGIVDFLLQLQLHTNPSIQISGRKKQSQNNNSYSLTTSSSHRTSPAPAAPARLPRTV